MVLKLIRSLNNFLTIHVLNLPRHFKRILVIILDIVLCISATWIALSLRLEEIITLHWDYAVTSLVAVGIAIPIFIYWGLYREIFRYSGILAFRILGSAMILYTFIYITIFSIVSIAGIPRSIGLLQPMIMFLLVGTSRLVIKSWLGQHLTGNITNVNKKGIIIYGAGNNGQQLASSLIHSPEFQFITFIDDNKNFWGNTIDGRPVTSPKKINYLIESGKVRELWLAIPNIDTKKRIEILNSFRKLPLHIRTLPSFSDLANYRVRLSDLRELDVNELLGRDPVKPNNALLQKCIFGKTVLITGAGGSIGSELCRQILNQNPHRILLVENSEVALYNIHSELNSIIKNMTYNVSTLVPILLDISNKNQLENIFEKWNPQTLYHAAAYKHVPMVEHNIIAGITNNVFGTLTCAKMAVRYKVEYFVLISTDKAVRPTNVMGASKRLAEMVLQSFSSKIENNNTCFSIVRFGNVLGSSGSVVPLFRKQIETGGPLTLTHEKVMRYFMTIQEAAQLVIQAGAMAKGGEVFLLDMGEPVYISDLARNMIEAAGLAVKDDTTPWGDVEIKVTGLRPGEKLFEELLISSEAKPTDHPRIFQAHEMFMEQKNFIIVLQNLTKAIDENNILKIRELLKVAVSGYNPSNEIVDWAQKKDNLSNSLH